MDNEPEMNESGSWAAIKWEMRNGDLWTVIDEIWHRAEWLLPATHWHFCQWSHNRRWLKTNEADKEMVDEASGHEQ